MAKEACRGVKCIYLIFILSLLLHGFLLKKYITLHWRYLMASAKKNQNIYILLREYILKLSANTRFLLRLVPEC